MTKIDNTTSSVRVLQESELDAVTGGIIAGCILPTEVPVDYEPRKPEPFRDPFAKYTIG
jgi:hypothetical protein